MTNKISWEAGKEYKLQNGWTAQIFAIDNEGIYPIQGRYFVDDVKIWCSCEWDINGISRKDVNNIRLMPLEPRRIKGECWLLIFDGGEPQCYESKPTVNHFYREYQAKAIVHVPYDVAEGEGLD